MGGEAPALSMTDPYSRYSSDVSSNDIALIFKILMERKAVILVAMTVSVLAAMVYLSQIKLNYEASTKVMLNSTHTNVRQSNVLQTLLRTGRLDSGDLLSQIQIMRSPEVIEQLVIDEKLFQYREFGGAPEFQDFSELSDLRQQTVIANVSSRLSVTPLAGTSIVEIRFESANAADAALIANAHPQAYAKNEEDKAKAKARAATDWLAERLKVLQEDVRRAEMALENAREENNLTLSQNSDVRLQQIGLLTQSLSKVEAQYAETQAILELIAEARKENKRLDAIPKFLSDRLAENLKFAEASLVRKQAVFSQRYGPNHPEMRALNAEMEAFQEKLNQEVDLFAESLANQLDIHSTKIREINDKIDEYRQSYKGDSEKRLRVRNLQTQVNTSRTLLNNFMGSYLESIQGLNIDQNPVRVIAEAGIPARPAVPNKMLIVFLSGVTGMFLGIFIALILERLEDSIKSEQQLEKLTGLPVYTTLPSIKKAKGQSARDYLFMNPGSVLAELMRSLMTALHLRDPHYKSGGRVITVTSTHTGEGKTTVSTWLAMTAVQAGKKVLVIDADMRRPSLHKAFAIGNHKGLADYLSDRLPLDDTIYKKDASHVHVMTSKAIPTHALTLLSSERMETLIRRVKDDYDLIILDVPTSHVFSDSRVCAKLSDKTLYVVEWKKTKRDEVKNTLKQFTDMNYQDISLVLNKVNDKHVMKIRQEDMAYMNAVM